MTVALNYAPANTNKDVVDQATVEVYSSTDEEIMVLTETGMDTGVFTDGGLCLNVEASTVNDLKFDGTMQVQAGGIIAALYQDISTQTPVPVALDVAFVPDPNAQSTYSYQVDTTIMPPALAGAADPEFPLAMVMDPDGVPAFFGENQVIFRTDNQADLDDFLARRGGSVVTTYSLPLVDDKGQVTQQMANFVLIKVDPSTVNESNLKFLMSLAQVDGTFTYSSLNAVKLMALMIEEQFSGNAVYPHALVQPQSQPVSNEGGTDWFTQRWYDPTNAIEGRVGAGQALSLMDVAEAPAPGTVTVSVIDGGFASPGDFTSGLDNPDYGVPFNSIPQCDINAAGIPNCAPGSAAGPNPLSCSGAVTCDWHGTQMFSVAGAEFDNGAGASGIGAHVVDPMFMKVGLPYLLPVASGIVTSVEMGADIINLSSGFPCRPLVVDICEPIQNSFVSIALFSLCELVKIIVPPLAPLPCASILALMAIPPMAGAMLAAAVYAAASDVMVVAAAGNAIALGIDGLPATLGPFDAGAVRLIPCVLPDVICVGNLDSDATDLIASAGSGFGDAVDIWAPGTGMVTTNQPDIAGLGNTTGTSPATAFISGTLALIRANDPTLTAAQTRAILMASRCHPSNTARASGAPACIASGDARVNTGTTGVSGTGGYVDAFEAVKQAKASAGAPNTGSCDGGWDEITTPADTLGTAILLTFAGDVATVSGNLSIHTLPADEDWYTFSTPSAGTASTEMMVELSYPAAHGDLSIELYDVFASAPRRLTIAAGSGGSASLSMFLMAGRDYYVRVVAPTPEETNDNCYGTTLTVSVVGPGPSTDAYEVNDTTATPAQLSSTGWVHTALDPRVYADFGSMGSVPVHDSAAVWNMTINNLSLHDLVDVDFYNVGIPDPVLTYPDIDPDPTVIEPISECGSTTRWGFPSGSLSVYSHGSLAVTVVDEGISPLDDLRFYRFGLPAPSLGRGTRLSKTIPCPRSRYSLTELLFAVGLGGSGDRPFPGNYSLELEYRIEVDRGRTALAETIIGSDEAASAAAMLCLSNPGAFCQFSGSQPPRGSFNENHPVLSGIINCIADGPGCWDYNYFQWSGGNFDMNFASDFDLSFALLDENMKTVAEAANVGQQAQAAPMRQQNAAFLKNIFVQELPPGFYVVRVGGTEGSYTVDYLLPRPATGVINGLVTDANQNPIAGATVVASTGQSTTTDANGNYQLGDLYLNTPLTLYAVAAPNNTFTHGVRWYDSTTADGATPITLAENQPVTINFVLQPAATISGTVLEGGTQTPLVDVPVYINGWPLILCTDENGSYTFDGLADNNDYLVAAGGVADGIPCTNGFYGLKWYPSGSTINEAQAVTATANGTTGIDFSLVDVTQTSVTLQQPTGTITTGYGNPIYQWSTSSSATSYDLWVGRAANSATVIYEQDLDPAVYCSSLICQIDPTTLSEAYRLYNDDYVVWIGVDVDAETTNWSGPFNFTLNAAPPQVPTQGATTGVTTGTQTLNWILEGTAANTGWFEVYVAPSAALGSPVARGWFKRGDVCGSVNGTTCALDIAVIENNTEYQFWMRGYGPGGFTTGGNAQAPQWAGPELFTVNVPVPNLPQNIMVDPRQGRPLVTWDADPNAAYFQVWMGPNATGNYFQWHSAADVCDAVICAIEPDINWVATSDPYQIWMQAWGPGGFSTGGTDAPNAPSWVNGPDWYLPTVAPLAPAGVSATTLDTSKPTLSWDGTANATWYNVVVEAAPPGTPWVYSNWILGYDLSAACGDATGVCSWQDPKLDGVLLPNTEYLLRVRAWGTGGMGGFSQEVTFIYAGP